MDLDDEEFAYTKIINMNRNKKHSIVIGGNPDKQDLDIIISFFNKLNFDIQILPYLDTCQTDYDKINTNSKALTQYKNMYIFFIVNKQDYIDISTLNLMKQAFSLGVELYIYNNIYEPYKKELFNLNVKYLHNNIDNFIERFKW